MPDKQHICWLFFAGAFCLFKLGTHDHPCEGELAYAQSGLPQLRLHLSTIAGGAPHRKLLEHPLVKEAVAYWNEALAVVTTANATRHTTVSKPGAVIWRFVLHVFALLRVVFSCFSAHAFCDKMDKIVVVLTVCGCLWWYIQASGLCGVTDSSVPDMTGLGGKARTVPSSTTSTTAKAAAKTEDEKPELATGAMEDLLSNVSNIYKQVLIVLSCSMVFDWSG